MIARILSPNATHSAESRRVALAEPTQSQELWLVPALGCEREPRSAGAARRAFHGKPLPGTGHDHGVVPELAAHLQRDATDTHVVAHDGISDPHRIELHRAGDAEAKQLLVEIDLPGRAELALDELLEAQKFLVSSSTQQQDLDQREVAGHGNRDGAGRPARREGQREEKGPDLHGFSSQKR